MPMSAQNSARMRKQISGSDFFWWILSISLFVGAWEIASYFKWLDPYFFPPPHDFVHALFEPFLFEPFGTGISAERYAINSSWMFLPKTIVATFGRVAFGLLVGFVSGAVIGFLIHYLKWFGYITVPMLRLLASISAVAWLPLAIVLFKKGNIIAWILVALSIVFIVALSVSEIIKNIPASHINVARVLGASRRQIFFQVILPYSLPKMYSLMRMNFFAAWMTVLLAETFDVEWGLGVIITLSRALLNARLAWASILIIGASGYIVDLLLRWLEKKLFWYNLATTVQSK
jgi:NitT/TauT family transport system permease protein